MAKITSVYICQQCGYVSPQFLGKCPECGSWNSLVEQIQQTYGKSSSRKNLNQTAEIINIREISKIHYDRLSSDISEFDRVLGGGIVPGSLILVSGDPGIGKSTLLSQLALNISNSLYISGEESAQQIKIRIDRIKKNANLNVVNEVDVDSISQIISKVKPKLTIVDSIQTLETTDLESVPGSISQVKECAHRLQKLSKSLHIPIFMVGHVTKEGTVAGPKTLEHLVDVVLNLEGEPTNQFRVLRSTKNRFGSTDEVGIFDMDESGMVEVKNPSKLFLEQKVNAPGSAVLAILTGLRPLLLEVQALVTKSNLVMPRRIGTGVDNLRLQLMIAVLSKKLNLPLYESDIFVNVTGGIKVTEPAADLGICMAIISSYKNLPIKPKTVFVGEVGLLGEVRIVRAVDRRLAEAKKLGFTNYLTPETVKTLNEALKQAF